jgi:hypothetical protein
MSLKRRNGWTEDIMNEVKLAAQRRVAAKREACMAAESQIAVD